MIIFSMVSRYSCGNSLRNPLTSAIPSANIYSAFTDGNHRVSFDKVVEVMKQTGHDLPSLYKETSEGGLAKDYEPMD